MGFSPLQKLLKTSCFIFIFCHSTVVLSQPKRDTSQSCASFWLAISLDLTAKDVDRFGARPTVLSRTLAMAMTALFDAWAMYDAHAVATTLDPSHRRPLAEHRLENKEIAMSYAIFRVLTAVYPADSDTCALVMRQIGLDPNNATLDENTPQGMGNAIAKALLSQRNHDGANQLGDEAGGNTMPYSDYTYYKPVNTYQKIIDPDHWQPIPFADGKGGVVVRDFLTPHWYRVKPFGLLTAAQFRPPPPPMMDSEQLKKEINECLYFNANLTPQRKAIIEFMRDGPRSTGQSGHWLRFARLVSQRDHYDLEQDVKLYFAVSNVAMDAFIAAWESKRFYDSARPWSLVRYYFGDQKIMGWGGCDKGTNVVTGNTWQPYSPPTFVTPPFPGYVSGHSAVSAACAKVLELFTKSDTFGVEEKRSAGILTETAGDEVSLPLNTFSETAEIAGLSRVMGGYHIQSDNIQGLILGRKVATHDWEILLKHFNENQVVDLPIKVEKIIETK
jgi:hypothetical protein